ncbi:hypothetical protein HK100_003455, partial [Physocladia obscura]
MVALLSEYADKIYGDEQHQTIDGEAVEDEEEDLEAAFAREVAGLNKPRDLKRFVWLSVGIECCLFVKCHDSICPTTLVAAILQDLTATKLQKTRYLQRIIPAAETCPAYMDQFVPMAQRVLSKHLLVDVAPAASTAVDRSSTAAVAVTNNPIKFSVVFSHRNNNSLTRDQVIPELAALVEAAARPTASVVVDIKNPDVCVVVE